MKIVIMLTTVLLFAHSNSFAAGPKLKGDYKEEYSCSVGAKKALQIGLYAHSPGEADVLSVDSKEVFERCRLLAGKRDHLSINCEGADEGKKVVLSVSFSITNGDGAFHFSVDNADSNSFPIDCEKL